MDSLYPTGRRGGFENTDARLDDCAVIRGTVGFDELEMYVVF